MMKKYNVLLFFVVVLYGSISAQEVLSLHAAIDSALLQNYRIIVARNQVEIASNNNQPGQAGMLPNVSLNISDSPANNNLRQEFANGSEIVRNNVNSNTLNTQLAATMTLYDGGKMFATRAKLDELENLAELTLRAEMQNLVSEVIVAYTSLVSLQQNQRVLQKLAESALARKELIEIRIDAGMANQADVYLVQLDLDQAMQALVILNQQIMKASSSLKILMKSQAIGPIQVADEVPTWTLPTKLSVDELFAENPQIGLIGASVKIATHSEREASALRYPKLTLSASYGYLLSQSQAGFSLYNQTYGATGSIGLNIPLFSGNVYKNNFENAKINREMAEVTLSQAKSDLQNRYELAWALYDSALGQKSALDLGVKNAQNYLEIMNLRFQQGQSTVLELREAERSFEEANLRKISNDITLKLAETDILRISGQLIR